MSAIAFPPCAKIDSAMGVSFGAWLDDLLNERGLSKADLARLSGLSKQAISDYTNLRRLNPDTNALIAIARGLKMPTVVVYRAAGLLPPATEDELVSEEYTYLWNQLSESDQADVLDFMRFKAGASSPKLPIIYDVFDKLSKEPRRGFLLLVQDPDVDQTVL